MQLKVKYFRLRCKIFGWSETTAGANKKITENVEYYADKLGITFSELTDGNDVLSVANYKSDLKRKKIRVLRRACKGTEALIEYDSLPDKIKEKVVAKYGNPHKDVYGIKKFYERDAQAMAYFSKYRYGNDQQLKSAQVEEYTNNASMLNTLIFIATDRKQARKAGGGSTSGIWDNLCVECAQLEATYKHSLPNNARRLKQRVDQYVKEGYKCLIHRNFANQNARKVNDLLEQLILSLYARPEKPYSKTVYEDYLSFIAGVIEVVDIHTGEIFQRDDFCDKDGTPILVSESTVWNIINNPANKAAVMKKRNTQHEYRSMYRPHHKRTTAIYSLSKISMDDRDLPRKMPDGNRVKAYYSYDVCSQVIIGKSYSRLKTTNLFLDCIKDMFRFLRIHNYGIPLEVEVEHHLVKEFKDDMMKAGNVFPLVRWCNAGNSQEKHAENFNRIKKYGYEKRYQAGGIGRFYSRLEANKPKIEKVFDEFNNTYKEKTFHYDEIVADDEQIISLYNNDLHSDQKKYPGMTRLQVLAANLNPGMAKLDDSYLALFIGEKINKPVGIRRNSYVRCQYNDYWLPTPEILKQLDSQYVDVYYIPGEDETINEVFLYQNERYVCTCKKRTGYTTARAEWTEADEAEYTDQSKYLAKFDKMVKEKKPARVKTLKASEITDLEDIVVKLVEEPMEAPETMDDYFEDEDDYSTEAMAQLALRNV